MSALKFTDGVGGFSHNGWSVTICRGGYGNKMTGRKYRYTYKAYKCERQAEGIGFLVTATINGNGCKREAIKAIESYQ